MARFDDVRTMLLTQRPELLAKIGREEADLHWFDEHVAAELVEEGQEESLALVLERLDERDRSHLIAIDRALDRIGRGDYGDCVVCGHSIGAARQRALPTTDRCRRCAAIPAPSAASTEHVE